MFYGSNLPRNNNPSWATSNAPETLKVPGGRLRAPAVPDIGIWEHPRWTRVSEVGRSLGIAVRTTCGLATAWAIGLPRRAGRRLYAVNDAEAGWRGWHVTETLGGLGRQYRDQCWAALRNGTDPRREEIRDDTTRPDGCPLSG